jgi:hypothetical protein
LSPGSHRRKKRKRQHTGTEEDPLEVEMQGRHAVAWTQVYSTEEMRTGAVRYVNAPSGCICIQTRGTNTVTADTMAKLVYPGASITFQNYGYALPGQSERSNLLLKFRETVPRPSAPESRRSPGS